MLTFAVFLLGYTLSQFFRSFLAVIAPELARDLGLTPADLGNISAIWFAVFAVSQFGVGIALDRIGPRRTVFTLMLAAVAGALIFAAAQTRAHCLIAMALIGLGCAPIYMGALFVFGRTYRRERFAFFSSWLLGLGASGNLLGATPLAYAAETMGWRASFAGIAAITGLSALLILLLVRDPPRAVSPQENAHPVAELAELISIRALWPLIPITIVSYAVVAAERGLWIGPFFADVYGFDPTERGDAALVMAAAMSLGALIYGPLDRVFGTHKWIVVAGGMVTAAGFMALAIWPEAGSAAAVSFLAVIGGFGMTYGVLMAHAAAYFPEHLLGRGITFMNFLFIGGAGLIQLLSGVYVSAMARQGLSAADIYAWLHFALGLALALSLIIYLFSREHR